MSLSIPSSQSVPRLPTSFPILEDILEVEALVQVGALNQAMGASASAGGGRTHRPPGSPPGCVATKSHTNLKDMSNPLNPAECAGVKGIPSGGAL